MQGHVKFAKIGGLHNVVTSVNHWVELSADACAVFKYRAKIKLHGANMGIRIDPNGELTAQSRNQDILKNEYQFSEFVEENKTYLSSLNHPTSRVVIFGEWAGPGVQRSVSVCKIEEKSFFVFAVSFVTEDEHEMVVDPEEISEILKISTPNAPKRMFVIPWFSDTFEVDFRDIERLRAQSESFNADVAEIDALDPYIKSLFDVEGAGEGLVYYPLTALDRESFGRYAFKVKGSGHTKAKGGGKDARVKTPISEDVFAFVETMVTPARVDQGKAELFGMGPYENSGLGTLIKWVANDVQEEGRDELKASDLAWPDVMRVLPKRVRDLYFTF